MQKKSHTEELFSTVIQLGKLISQRTQESYEEKTATLLQFKALHCIKDQQYITVSTLARLMQLSKSSATQLVERLVKAQVVERLHDAEDRRIIRLTITSKGEKAFIALRQKLISRMQQFTSKIPEKDIKELIRINRNLINTLRIDNHEYVK